MIALLTTYLIVAYVLIPGVLFRLPASLFVQLRLFQLSKTQEATFGCFVSLMPFLLALFLVWHVPLAQHHPFPISESTSVAYRDAYRNALTVVVAEDPSRFLERTIGKPNPYTESLNNLEHRQLRFLFWYYVLIALEGVGFGYLTRKYGDWSEFVVYELFARKILLPRLSEWQLLLTDFTFPKKPKRDVFADVLSDAHLYRGRVGDYFLDSAGDLSGVFLKEVARFRRADFESARSKPGGGPINKEEFWTKIPGANFYIPADKITNLNVRFPYENSFDLQRFLEELLKDSAIKTTISVDPDGTNKSVDESEQGQRSTPPQE